MTERDRRQFVERDLSKGYYSRTPRIIPAGDRNEEKKRREDRERIVGGQEGAFSVRGRRTRGRGRKIYPKE